MIFDTDGLKARSLLNTSAHYSAVLMNLKNLNRVGGVVNVQMYECIYGTVPGCSPMRKADRLMLNTPHSLSLTARASRGTALQSTHSAIGLCV